MATLLALSSTRTWTMSAYGTWTGRGIWMGWSELFFAAAREDGVKCTPTKLHFGYDKVESTGHVVGQEGIEVMAADKVDKAAHFELMNSKKTVRAFPGAHGVLPKVRRLLCRCRCSYDPQVPTPRQAYGCRLYPRLSPPLPSSFFPGRSHRLVLVQKRA